MKTKENEPLLPVCNFDSEVVNEAGSDGEKELCDIDLITPDGRVQTHESAKIKMEVSDE